MQTGGQQTGSAGMRAAIRWRNVRPVRANGSRSKVEI
jgi:hypothetical protein